MIITALIMGFAGSLHCVGMCSPLAMMVSNLNPAATLNRFVYNLGRILTYGLLGAIVGGAGWALPLAGFQNILSLALGMSLVLFAVLGITSLRIPVITPAIQKSTSLLKAAFGKFLQRKNYISIFILGSLNGLLPCGLTFLALTYCLTLGSVSQSFYFMLLFGAGTLPVMLGLTTIFQYLVKRFNLSFRKVTTTMLFLSGCLLIARVFIPHSHDAHHVNTEHTTTAEITICR
jgi:sulfite exporter TauE/SafE